MAKLVVTTTATLYKIETNDYSTILGATKMFYLKDKIVSMKLGSTGISIVVENEGDAWNVSFDGASNTLQIDSVDGVAPTSNSDLYNLLVSTL